MAATRIRRKHGGGRAQEPAATTLHAQSRAGTVEAGGLFAGLRLGKALHHKNLTVFPLSWSQPHEPTYILLSRAIESGQAVVEEVSESGSVPNLAVTNKAERPLLIPEGEILCGAKQNRVVNITVLVAAGVKFLLPVSCVEAGRWRYQSRQFESKFCAPPSLRSKNLRAVQTNRAEHGVAASDQGEVWGQVQACLTSVNATSDTASLTDGFVAAQEKLDEYREALPLPPDAAALLVAQGNHVIGMDLFDTPITLQSLWGRLRDSYFFDALGDRLNRRQASRKSAQTFLERVAAASRPRASAIGLGEELEIAGDDIVGAALVYAGQLCHLSAFAISC
jgi:hypothetical protein